MKWKWPRGLPPWLEGLQGKLGVVLVMAVGAVLLLLPTGGADPPEPTPDQSQSQSFDLEVFEEKVARTLSEIRGAGEVEVVLTVQSSSRQILAQDVEQGREGEERRTHLTLSGGGGAQGVVPLQTISPQFRGALVVCDGGENPQIQLAISQALSALTGLGSDRIVVCPR